MAYEANTHSGNPTLFAILLDQSGSMEQPWAGGDPGTRKDTALADIVNSLIAALTKNCLVGGVVRDRIHLCILGYGGSNTVGPAWGGNLEPREVVPISEVDANPVGSIPKPFKLKDGDGLEMELVKKVNIWITPKSNGGTPMAEAFDLTFRTVEKWLGEPSGVDPKLNRKDTVFPPIVCNITDGEPNDAQRAVEASTQIRDLATQDGSVLLMNIHVSNTTDKPYAFPVDESELPPSDKEAPFLFKVSSTLPDELLERAQTAGLPVRKGSRLLIGNADAALVIGLLSFASTASQASSPRS